MRSIRPHIPMGPIMNPLAPSMHDRHEAMNAILAQNWWAMALRGGLAVLFGILAFVLPGATILSLVLIFAAFSLVDGIFEIVAAIRGARAGERWGLLLLHGIAGLVIGIGAFVWPGITVLAFVLMIAAWALIWAASPPCSTASSWWSARWWAPSCWPGGSAPMPWCSGWRCWCWPSA
jgi:uncharacterized membrane protein HdeD (DUF308 family)